MKFIKNFIKSLIPKTNKAVYFASKNYTISISEKLKLSNKIALITGGNGGIGRAICYKLAAEGAKVYVSGRNVEKVQSLVEEMHLKNLQAEAHIMDVSDIESIEKAFDNLFQKEDHIDILVNCAGGGLREERAPLYEQSVELIDKVLNTNLRGTILCSRKAAQKMVKNNYGRIITISSVVATKGMSCYSEYGAAKSGDIGFMKSLALDLGKHNITVNCVSPGMAVIRNLTKDDLENKKRTNCMNTIVSVEDVANAVFFLSTDEAKHITAQNLVVDAGRSLGLYGN